MVAIVSYPLLASAWTAYFDPSVGMGGSEAVPIIVARVCVVGLCSIAAAMMAVISARRAYRLRQSFVLTASGVIVAGALVAYLVAWMYSIKLGYEEWALTPELAAIGRFNRNCFTTAMLGCAGMWVGCLFERRVVE